MAYKIIVNKFGGGILTKQYIPLIKIRIQEQIKAGFIPVIIVSAMNGITDEIINFLHNKNVPVSVLIKNLLDKHNVILSDMEINIDLKEIFSNLENDLNSFLKNPSNAFEDKVASYGEKISATIIAHYLNDLSIPVVKFLAEEIPIITDNNFKNANINYTISEKNIQNKFDNLKVIPIIPGFTGVTKNRQTTTLGRGGTDTTACFIGAAIRAYDVILWKDVAGVLSADPKIIPEARTIPEISYIEAEESGKVIHDKAIQYIKMFKTPLEITSIINSKLKTKISNIVNTKKGAKIVSSKKNLKMLVITDEKINMSDIIADVGQSFSKHKVDIILISNTRYSLQIVADNKNGLLDQVINELKDKFGNINITDVNMFFLVGHFNVKDVNNFNDLLIKQKADIQISAFLYENCTRLEAVVKSNRMEDIIRVLYKKFIK